MSEVIYLPDLASSSIRNLLLQATPPVMFVGSPGSHIDVSPRALDRMAEIIRDSNAGIVYSDSADRPRIDYQLGSIRDNFDFGSLMAISSAAARSVDLPDDFKWAGLYDLRLRISEKWPIVRIPESLYTTEDRDTRTSGQKQFDYVDPRNREYQLEMEAVATAHLKRIGAFLEPRFDSVPPASRDWPVHATIVIPVRNRERTILDSVHSVLGQRASFSFNVIVVDNHSTDQTTALLDGVTDPRLVHIIPARRDLAIGGCWNEALYSAQCGCYAVQLDSDDLYSDSNALARLVEELERGPYAMVVGSYTIVDFSLKTIPPGLIDHREWTRENGRNNALRINGLGAPRAFRTEIVRRFGFPNVSYGEDYAVALRIARDFEIGRVYESVYSCRRWEGNTDSALPQATFNRYDSYKDWIRSNEIRARQH